MIKNIIFDLGGVIEDIDYNRTIDAFKGLGINDFEALYTQANQVNIFDRLDRGEFSYEEFRKELCLITGLYLKDKQIDDAWNAMILKLPYSRLKLLDNARNNYRSFLLSNTNAMHIEKLLKIVKEEYGVNEIGKYFERVYLSYVIGMRKPESRIFEYVLNENDLKPEETLFIDDSVQHIESAANLGIKTYFFKPEEECLEDIFDDDGFLCLDFV